MGTIGAAVWSTGRAGRVIVEAGLIRPWIEFRGGIVYSAAKEGLDLGKDIIAVNANFPVARAQLEAGRVDAALVIEPLASIIATSTPPARCATCLSVRHSRDSRSQRSTVRAA